MTDDKFDPDESHFSDEELEAAAAGFEKEFAGLVTRGGRGCARRIRERIRGRFGIRRCQ